ncbi:uncharacterized protein LOC141594954 [Silene latifolia]|uniref:uncharacterized protein LOC141594954 n=1 Tax=Silene latifolia TaxID=37657 RepID=UPI003D77515B
MAFASKNKLGFVDGSCSQPPKTDKKFNQWVRSDLLVMRWILNSLVKPIRENLKYVRLAKELWGEMTERYGQANAIEVYQLKKDLDVITKSNMSLVDYYSKLKVVWETLDSVDPLPQCSCGKLSLCSCNLMKLIITRENNAKLIQFLMGLNNGYDTISTQILSMDLLPTINRSVNNFAKNVKSVGKSSKNVKKHCSHCTMDNHNLEECFRVNPCAYCGKEGHKIENCYRLVGFPNDKNGFSVDPSMLDGLVSSVVDQVLKRMNENTPSSSTSNFAGMIPDSLANSVNGTFMLLDWIIDTGASDHMTFNLLSKLIDKNSVYALFTATKCFFQDHSNKTIIASGSRVGNLYIFQNFNTKALIDRVVTLVSQKLRSNKANIVKNFQLNNCIVQDVSSLNFVALIHSRLGYTSFDRLKYVPGFHINNKRNVHCETYVLSKHHLLPFSVSTSRASCLFELIHMDVWGPYKLQGTVLFKLIFVNPATTTLLIPSNNSHINTEVISEPTSHVSAVSTSIPNNNEIITQGPQGSQGTSVDHQN